MITLKNISKTYRSKKGKNTKALDNVSLTLGNKGMTFILGKSGSGKSTLLNLLGGLDQYDSGDMIILGKSSKDFTQADFDSYRNTYVGFVFQEFNILEDYDVYENIVLALQLQQKKVIPEEVNALLDRLELTELKKRKMNELSGGQKQRVAIARALIKNPKIILADEPTGNLDSKTGKQVMELLKEISKEKLVVIVSHDEEYAEMYGDRIIEIKDGKIIKDTNNVIDEKVAHHYETIKSKLPFKESFKLGIGSLKHKKIKLFFTILLTVVTLGFLSCTDTLSSYKVNRGHAKLLREKNEQFIQIYKNHYDTYDGQIDLWSKLPIEFSLSDVDTITSKVDNNGYNVYRFYGDYDFSSIESLLHINTDSIKTNELYTSLIGQNKADIVVVDDINQIVEEQIIGRKATNPNEIVISNYTADLILKGGIYVHEVVKQDEFQISYLFEPTTYEEILNTGYTYYFGELGSVKIVGIVNYDVTPYQQNNISPAIEPNDYENLRIDFYTKVANLYNKIFVSNNFIENVTVDHTYRLKSNYNYVPTILGLETDSKEGIYTYHDVQALDEEIEYFDGTNFQKTSTLGPNEVIISLKSFAPENYQQDLQDYLDRNSSSWDDRDYWCRRFFANYVTNAGIIGQNVQLNIYIGYSYELDNPSVQFNDLKVVGVTGFDEYNYDDIFYFSKDILDEYKAKPFQQMSILYPVNSQKEFEHILDIFPYNQEFSAESSYSDEVNTVASFIEEFKQFAFWGSVIFLVFAVCLISNFVVTSIHYRKKEIGVLRALGSRSSDVAKIFLWEGICMALISGIVASILLVVVTNFMNDVIMSQMTILITPFIVGIRQFVVIFLVVFIVTIISSLLPIIRISKMKPIDAILNKK